MSQRFSEQWRDMLIEWDVPIEMSDGVVLRADVFRPGDDDDVPVIMSYGPYGKWYLFEDRSPDAWETMVESHPEVDVGTTSRFQNWETVDPEKWVPDGYAVVRVDSRGAGRSPGYLDVWSAQETEDFAECIEWGGRQPWSNGKVGLSGISYYGMNQWQVAALQPDPLEAICPWEAAADWYRDYAYNGGIYSTFGKTWYPQGVVAVQHGQGSKGPRSRLTGGWVAGPETLSEEELGSNRADHDADMIQADLADDDYWTSRNPDWSKVDVPLLSATNWGDHGLHTRGNFEGYLRAASEEKWLEVHGREHWTEYYTDYGVELQKRFFGHFLKDEDTGWTDQPRVQLHVRNGPGDFTIKEEQDWPIPRTDWTRYYLNPTDRRLTTTEPDVAAEVTYEALGDGVTFLTDPFEKETEVTGPIAAKLFVSSDTEDADLFLVLREFDAELGEVVYQGAIDPNTPPSFGWLRASHRKLDPELSEPWRPYHPHDEREPLEPGQVYELDIEIWPTSVTASPGSRLALSVRGKDYQYPPHEGGGRGTGVGWFRHNDARDRPTDIYGGQVTVHAGPDHPSHVRLPVIPE